jgi:hypothetical protein
LGAGFDRDTAGHVRPKTRSASIVFFTLLAVGIYALPTYDFHEVVCHAIIPKATCHEGFEKRRVEDTINASRDNVM